MQRHFYSILSSSFRGSGNRAGGAAVPLFDISSGSKPSGSLVTGKSRIPTCLSCVKIQKVQLQTSPRISFLWRNKPMGETQSTELPDTRGMERKNKVKLTDAEWKAKLTPEEYHVCRNHGTERAWTGELLDKKGKGIFQCACCGADLFNSSTKFDSGSGWPSFYDTLKDKDDGSLPAVDTHTDRSHGMVRTEVLCGKCDSHLGHVFNDGPQPTGLRYCINSVSLKFKRDAGESGKSRKPGESSKNEL